MKTIFELNQSQANGITYAARSYFREVLEKMNAGDWA